VAASFFGLEAELANLIDDRILNHNQYSSNSSGVQMTGVTKP
jgi:hypothetical protein